MKFTINQESLLDALKFVTNVIERRQMRPILASVLVDAVDNTLRLRATDMEILLDTTLDEVTVFDEGSIALPGKKWQDVVTQLSGDEEITIESQENSAVVSAGRNTFHLVTLPAEDFPPQVNTGDQLASLTIDREGFLYMLRTAAVTMAQSDIRHYFKTTLLELEPAHVRTVSTNGMCLCVCEVGLEGKGNVEFDIPTETEDGGEADGMPVQALIPRKAALELPSAIGVDAETVQIGVGRNYLAVECGARRLITNLVDSNYPRYQTVVPDSNSKVLGLDRDGLVRALQAVLITANVNTPLVKFGIDGAEHVTVTSRNEVGDDGACEIAAEWSEQDSNLDIAFDGSQLVNVLNAFGSENVKMKMAGSTDSVLVTSDHEPGLRYVVSPLRLS